MSVKKRIKKTKIGKKIIARRDKKLINRFCQAARDWGYQYIFSVIIPIYNAEKYLEECINSVILQTVGFANIQIILVNDGSSDDSEGICKRYCERYPENIVLYSQKNAGVSAARNTGLEHVKGMYVSFLDSDDKWSGKTFLQLLGFFRDFGTVDIVAVKEKFFDARKGDHPRNHAFKKDRIVDLEREPDVLPVTSPQVIIKSSVIGEVRFDEKLLHSEDALFTTEILFNVDSFGIASEPVYYYRKRTDSTSTVDTIEAKKHYYNEALELYHNYIIEESKKRFGIVKKYVQYELAYNIGWRIKVGLPEILNEKELRDYRKKLKDIFQYIDDDIIAQQKSFELHHRVYMIALKYNINYADAVSNLSAGEDDKISVELADGQHCAGMIEKNFSSCIIQFLTVEKESGELCVEGRLDRCRILPGQASLEWNCNEKNINPIFICENTVQRSSYLTSPPHISCTSESEFRLKSI